MTPAELAILVATVEVEAVGADVRLTDAVVLLQAARDSVADYVDGIDKRRHVAEDPGARPAPVSAYYVEVDHDGCGHCSAGKTWTVVGPDGTGQAISWGTQDEADDVAAMLNAAFECGQQQRAAPPARESQLLDARAHMGDGDSALREAGGGPHVTDLLRRLDTWLLDPVSDVDTQELLREARARIAQMAQERDKWLDLFNRSEQFQSGPTKRAEQAEAQLRAAEARVRELEGKR